MGWVDRIIQETCAVTIDEGTDSYQKSAVSTRENGAEPEVNSELVPEVARRLVLRND